MVTVKRRVILRTDRRIVLRVDSKLISLDYLMGYDCIKEWPRAYSSFLKPQVLNRRSICPLFAVRGSRPRDYILS